ARGAFSFRASEIGWAESTPFLNGRATVERVPNMFQLTSSTQEQDYPAIAQRDDTVYVAYVEFKHGDRAAEGRKKFDAPPKSFDFLARPAGGDQVLLARYKHLIATGRARQEVEALGRWRSGASRALFEIIADVDCPCTR